MPDPAYGIKVSSATVTIRDTAEVRQTLTATLRLDQTLQRMLKGQPGSRLVLETKTGSTPWTPIRTNLLFNGASAITVSLQTESHAIFRTARY